MLNLEMICNQFKDFNTLTVIWTYDYKEALFIISELQFSLTIGVTPGATFHANQNTWSNPAKQSFVSVLPFYLSFFLISLYLSFTSSFLPSLFWSLRSSFLLSFLPFLELLDCCKILRPRIIWPLLDNSTQLKQKWLDVTGLSVRFL